MYVGLYIRGRGFDSHKETWRERELVKNIKPKTERERDGTIKRQRDERWNKKEMERERIRKG